jgi:hypothetical protein
MDTQRRSVAFENLDEVWKDVMTLLADGYSASGNWNLAQVCAHLNDWMRFPMDGYPKPPAPIRAILWVMKVTIGRKQLNGILNDGFRPKTPTMPQTVHATGEETDAAAAEQFLETINRFRNYDGPIATSPVFGKLTAEEALNLQLRHCAHHLSFLTPKTPDS